MKSKRVDTKKEPKDGEVKRLKRIIAKLTKEKEEMAATIKQLRKQINDQQTYIGKKVEKIDLKNIMDSITLDDAIKDRCPVCNSEHYNEIELKSGFSILECQNCGKVTFL